MIETLAAVATIATLLLGLYLAKNDLVLIKSDPFFSTGFKTLKTTNIVIINDKSGEDAVREREVTLKCIKEGADLIKFIVTADGQIGNHETNSGTIYKEYRERRHRVIEVKLDEPRQIGDIFNVKFSCKLINCFIHEIEYWSFTNYVSKSELRHIISFPYDRHPTKFSFFKAVKMNKQVVSDANYQSTIDETGRMIIDWNISNAKAGESYIIEWQW